ncbi:MAG: MarR family winged helix-turn-helix transcriptional regulator [Anaerolineae bacterium]
MSEPTNPDHVNLDDWQLIAQLCQIFRNCSDAFTDQVDIPRGQAAVLCVVARQSGMTQSAIAETLFVQGATITTMLQKMEEAGLVIRRRDTDDNRLVRVYITETGLQKEQRINEQWGTMQDLAFNGLSSEDRDLLRRCLQQIIQNILNGR